MTNQSSVRLSDYIAAIVNRKIRTISLSITDAMSLLRTLATSTQTAASTTETIMLNFESIYLGALPSDPTHTAEGGAISLGAFYIRTTDGRFRWASAIVAGLPTWSDANVLAWPIEPGLTTITGAGSLHSGTAGVQLDNTNASYKINVIQDDDGHFSLVNATSGAELFSINSGQGYIGSYEIMTTNNGGSGSGFDSDLLRGEHWTSGQDTTFGIVKSQTPNSGSEGGLVVGVNATSGLAIIQITDHTYATEYGHFVFTPSGDVNWVGAEGISVNGFQLATLTSPVLLGTPTTPTPDLGDNSLKIANSSFVNTAIEGSFSYGTGTTGRWRSSPDGAGGQIVEQWITVSGTVGTASIYDFPTPFLVECFFCNGTYKDNNHGNGGSILDASSISDSQFQLSWTDNYSTGGSGDAVTIKVYAVGRS